MTATHTHDTAARKSVVFEFPETYPELLEAMGQIIGAELLELGLTKDQANGKCLKICDAIRRDLGGQQMYLSKGLDYELSLRDDEIYKGFKGNNYHTLARKYHLSEMQVRNIVKRGQLRDQARRQNKLF